MSAEGLLLYGWMCMTPPARQLFMKCRRVNNLKHSLLQAYLQDAEGVLHRYSSLYTPANANGE